MQFRIEAPIIAALLACLGCSSASGDPMGQSAGSGGNGGSGGSGASGGAGGAIDVCPEQHEAVTAEGHDVIVCEILHADPPQVRPPADDANTAFVATDGVQLFVRGEPPRDLDVDEQAALGVDQSAAARLYGYSIYRATRDDAGRVVEAAVAVVIEDAALLGFLDGKTAEGLVSRHVMDGNAEFEQTPTLPIRVRLGSVEPAVDVDPAMDEITAPAQIAVVVENVETGVVSAAGPCFPALADAGAESPFAGAQAVTLRAYRYPAMHGPADNELVLDGTALNHMSPAWMPMPHHLLLGSDMAFEDADFSPHGNPLSMPRLELGIVAGGGAACSP